MSTNIQSAPFTCPACGLLCDDITPSHNTCAKSVAFFAQGLGDNSPKIKGKNASLGDAITAAASILKNAKKPLFAGLSTDIAGFKAVYNLAQKTGGELQHMHAQSLARNLKVLQSTGWQTTTLGEVKNRADLIVSIGSDIAAHHPRFVERFVAVDGMFISAKQREMVHIGSKTTAPKGAWMLPCSDAALPEVLTVLHALVLGKSLKVTQVAGLNIADLQTLANKLKAAKYAVLTWIAKDLDFPHAELAIEQITQIVTTLNKTARAAGLPLGGSDGDTSANNAHTWLKGLALNNDAGFGRDALIWMNSFNLEKPAPKTDLPFIVLGNANMQFAQTPDVLIPIATPGLDCSGTMFRVDGAVILPLKKVRENDLPALSNVVNEIEKLL